MADLLTPKQEAFCIAYIESGNSSEAYRRAYNAERMKPNTVNRMAHDVLVNHKVAARIKELQSFHIERHNVTIDDLIKELDEARGVALHSDSPQPSAAISATLGKSKLLGLNKPKPPAFKLETDNLTSIATSILEAIASGSLPAEHGTMLLDSTLKLARIKDLTDVSERLEKLEKIILEDDSQ